MAWRRSKTGQIIWYINRTYRVLPTSLESALDGLAGIGMILMLFVPFRARFMVARDHQIPFRGARPDRHSPAFAFDGHCDSSQQAPRHHILGNGPGQPPNAVPTIGLAASQSERALASLAAAYSACLRSVSRRAAMSTWACSKGNEIALAISRKLHRRLKQ